MKRRTLAVAGLTVAVLGGTIAPAAATWNTPGYGPGASRAGQLQPAAAGPVTATSAGTHLTWSAPATGPVPGGYLVTRDGATICTTTGTACDDANLTPGTTYTYLVTSTAGQYWVSATPLVMHATTADGGFTLSALNPSSTTAGVGLTFTVSATYGAGVTDAAYTGAHALTITSSVPASPGGKASGGQATATFVSGVATRVATTVYGSGVQTLTVSDGSRTGSLALTVSPAAASTLELVNAAGNAVLCAPNGHVSIAAGGQLIAKVALVDAYGNITTAGGTLNLTLGMTGSGTLSTTSLSISNKASLSSSSFTLTMPSGTVKSGTLTVSSQGSGQSTTCSVN